MNEHRDQPEWIMMWGDALSVAACEACNSTFLLPAAQSTGNCPYCGQPTLGEVDYIDNEMAAQTMHIKPPEQTIPFALSEAQLHSALKTFDRRFMFAPSDMTNKRLRARVRPVFLPMWLVDTDVTAQWQAEMGYHYDVVSHRELYKNGRWQTQEITKTKLRWEPRVGTLARRYDNHAAPALEEHGDLLQKIGTYALDKARPYTTDDIADRAMRLPNRSPEDAWPEAAASIKTAAADECRQAANADRINEFKWAGQFDNKEWTQLLLPVYTTYYQDDNGRFLPIFIHGQSGKLYGIRRASPKKAKRWSIIIAIAALLSLCFSMILGAIGLAEEAVLPWALLFLLGAMAVGVTAVFPHIIVWYINNESS